MKPAKGRRITDPEERLALERLDDRLRDFPGSTELRLQVWREGEPPPELVGPDISEGLKKASTLRTFRELLGGDEGVLTDSRGGKHPVSLAPWAADDPDRTYVVPTFIFTPEESRLEEWKTD